MAKKAKKTLQQLEAAYDAACAERDRLYALLTPEESRALTVCRITTDAQRAYEAACKQVRDLWWEHTSLGMIQACTGPGV